MKKRLHGLVALLLAMLMVISNLAWAKEPAFDGDKYDAALQKGGFMGGMGFRSGDNEDVVVVRYSSYAYDWCYEGQQPYRSGMYPSSGWIDEELVPEDIPEALLEKIDVTYNLWTVDLMEFESGEVYYSERIVGTPNTYHIGDTISVEDLQKKQVTYSSTEFSKANILPVLEIRQTPKFTKPTEITAGCGQKVEDFAFPQVEETYSDGTPIGDYSFFDGDEETDISELVDEETGTVLVCFTFNEKEFDSGDLPSDYDFYDMFKGYFEVFEVPVTITHSPDSEDATPEDYVQDGEDGHHLVCEDCGESFASEEHTFDDGKVVREATAEQDGLKVFTCTVCGFTKDESITYVAPETEETGETEETDETEETVETEETSETEETEEVVESETPTESEEVVESETPTESEEVVESETPVESESPAESETPAESEAPAASANTGDAMNTTLMAIIMLAGLCCVLAFRKRVR